LIRTSASGRVVAGKVSDPIFHDGKRQDLTPCPAVATSHFDLGRLKRHCET
jgi:hypothetical protein